MPNADSSKSILVAELLLRRLGELGVDYLFGNAGTDFGPVIEAFACAQQTGANVPVPIVVPHENLAVAMAHGYYHATGRPQAVMLHVNVGTANALCGLFNAAKDNIPLLLFAGRTPLSDGDAPGARSVFIHWGQEMFDQAGMVREAVKWDYELRLSEQTTQVVDRAHAIAMSEPRGPVYVTLPRELLAQQTDCSEPSPIPVAAVPAATDTSALAQLAEWIIAAENPLLITASFGRHPDDVAQLSALCQQAALPVVAYRPRYMALPTDHPMHIGFEPAEALANADLVIVLDCDVPWIPRLHTLRPGAKVVQIGADPLFVNYPMRSFPCDLAITANAITLLGALAELLRGELDQSLLEARRTRVASIRTRQQQARNIPVPAADAIATVPWIAHCLNQAKRDDDIVVTETVFPMQLMDFQKPGTHFGTSPAGGLGWALGESIGLMLADRTRRVIAVVGDGTYMFGNPTPAHFMCEAHQLPVLTIILNNGMWGAVRRATLGMYPDGAAARTEKPAFTQLQPSPRFEHVVQASGGYAERVELAADLPQALQRALHAVDVEQRQAVLNVICHYSDESALQDANR
jgi:acetolactate synthase-1/2/3 large subunit